MDTTVYTTEDTTHWAMELVNSSTHSIVFDCSSRKFYDWKIYTSSGILVGFFPLFFTTYTLPPDSTLSDYWDHPIAWLMTVPPPYYAGFGLQPGTYYATVKPWYNYYSTQFDTLHFRVEEALSIKQESITPVGFQLYDAYPNPFNPVTIIHYELPVRSEVQVTIYDLLGKEITTLVSEIQEAGIRSVQWYATNVASGVYYYQIRAGEYVQTMKMVVLK